jgi:hypothetical protein
MLAARTVARLAAMLAGHARLLDMQPGVRTGRKDARNVLRGSRRKLCRPQRSLPQFLGVQLVYGRPWNKIRPKQLKQRGRIQQQESQFPAGPLLSISWAWHSADPVKSRRIGANGFRKDY